MSENFGGPTPFQEFIVFGLICFGALVGAIIATVLISYLPIS